MENDQAKAKKFVLTQVLFNFDQTVCPFAKLKVNDRGYGLGHICI